MMTRSMPNYKQEDENDFIGFDDKGNKSKKICQRLHQRGYVELAERKQPLGSSTKHDHIAGTAKRKVGRPKNSSTGALANNTYYSQKGETINTPEDLPAQLQEAKNSSSVGARSSRILKPIKRLVEDDAEYENERDVENSEEDNDIRVVQQAGATKVKRPVGRPRKSPSLLGIPSRNLPTPEPEVGGDRVSRNISLYADTISSHATQGVNRLPKRGIQDGDTSSSAVPSRILPALAAASTKVQEKIEKILQSPWDGRVKQATAPVKPSSSSDSPSKAPLSSVAVSKNILRKARLHLNKRTLQKIRNPVSVQHLLQQPGEDSGVSSCAVCQVRGKCEHQYGVASCHSCTNFLTLLSEQPLVTELPCSRGYGGCQLVGISIEERCNACWLSHALLSCSLPSLMHDRLRKKLPLHLKERVPTSLARSVYITEMGVGGGSEHRTHGRLAMTSSSSGGSASVCNEDSSLEVPPLLTGMFGSIIDLPGGWKRKTGPEVVVISPSGEKFKSVPKLEEYLSKQGICTDASILFGGASAALTTAASDASSNHLAGEDGDGKSKSKKKKKKKKKRKSHSHDVNPLRLSSSNNNCVLTTLPGGWVRRIRFRSVSTVCPHRRFDVYVTSPDGRTFRSKKQLSAYFHQIGKVDDILKYFPLFHEQGGGDQVATSSERTETESSTEPGSSSELWSEVEPDASEVISDAEEHGDETQQERRQAIKPAAVEVRPASVGSIGSPGCRNKRGGLSFVSIKDASQENFVGFEKPKNVVQTGNANSVISENVKTNYNDLSKESNVGSVLYDSWDDSSSACDTIPSDSKMKSKRGSVSIHLPSLPCMNFLPPDEPKDSGEGTSHEGLFNKPLVPTIKRSKRQMGISEKLLNLPKVEATFRLDLPKIPRLKIPKMLSPPESSSNSVDVQSSHLTEFHHDAPEHSIPLKPISGNSEELVDSNPKCDETVAEVILPKPQIQSLVPTFKAFQTQHIGGGWSRKIKWNPDGTGRVSFVITPSGSKIQSMIELQGYLKKEGAPTTDASFYFPQQLKREDVPEKVLPTPRVLKVKTPVSNEKVAGKKKVAQDCGHSLGAGTPGTNAGAVAEQVEDGVGARQDGEADSAAVGADSGGPRIKRVCRSLEQALGMPRATFPVPEDKENKDVLETESDFTSNDSSAQTSDAGIVASSAATGRMKVKKTAKVYSVMTTAAGKILRKTQWCNRCSGCLIPNCRKCGNCMDMVKYGGPGTKKKPCVQRKCINPRLSVHSFHKPQQMQQHNPISRSSADNSSTPATGPAFPTPGAGAATGKKMPPIKVTKRQTKKLAEMQKRAAEMDEEEEKADRMEEEELAEDYAREVKELMREQERIVFVPRQMARPVQEIKERSDAAGGKSVVPGALVNIDYWQGYDEDEVLEQGFPVLQAAPLHLSPLCFRCGSKGKEEMLWCSWCCEGVHPYCLEEGEGPQSSREECCWVCRRCAVCHVCGAGGITEAETASLQLMRCSACFYYYHLECLGPGAHETCTPPNDALWEGEMLMHLHWSWPLPPPIFRVHMPPSTSCQDIPPSALPQSAHDKKTQQQTQSTAAVFGTSFCLLSTSDFSRVVVKSAPLESAEGREVVNDPLTDELDATVLTLLESGPGLCQQSLMSEPRCFVLPQPESQTGATKKDDLPLDLPEVTCVADEIDGFDLMEMDGIDLDAIMDGLDEDDEDFNIMDPQFDEEDVIELFTDVDFGPASIVPDISKGDILPDVYGIEDDEYLCLGYKKITEYPPTRFELSNYRTLQMLHTELFIALGCPTVKQLEQRKLIYYRRRGRRSIPHCRVTRPYQKDSETDTASEGTEESDDESDLDWESLLEIRRHEALEELKERMELKGLQQKRLKEMEVEREQQMRNKGCRERMRKKLNKCLKKRRIENRRVSDDKEEGDAEDMGDDDEMWEPNGKKKKRKYTRRTLQVGEGEEEEEEKKTVNWDDEVYFWEHSDVDVAHEHEAERLARWQPQSFEELDALFEQRSLQGEEHPTADDHDEGNEGDGDSSGEGASRGVMDEVGSVGEANVDEGSFGESNEMVATKEGTEGSSTARAMKKMKNKELKMLAHKEGKKVIKRKKKLKKNVTDDKDRRHTLVIDTDQKEGVSDNVDASVNKPDNTELPHTPNVKKKKVSVKKLHFDKEPHRREDNPQPNDRWPTLTKLKETLLDRRKRPYDEPVDEPPAKKVSVNENTIECDIEMGLDESPQNEKYLDDTNNSIKKKRNNLCQLLDSQVTSGSDDVVFLDLGFDESGNEKSVVIEVMVTGEDSADEEGIIISPDFNPLASDGEDDDLVTGRRATTSRLSIGKDGLYYLDVGEHEGMGSAGGSTFVVDEVPLSADGGTADRDVQPTLTKNTTTTTPVNSTRNSRRSGHGRASELASLRKAKMDM